MIPSANPDLAVDYGGLFVVVVLAAKGILGTTIAWQHWIRAKLHLLAAKLKRSAC
jgi:hypothetical protein